MQCHNRNEYLNFLPMVPFQTYNSTRDKGPDVMLTPTYCEERICPFIAKISSSLHWGIQSLRERKQFQLTGIRRESGYLMVYSYLKPVISFISLDLGSFWDRDLLHRRKSDETEGKSQNAIVHDMEIKEWLQETFLRFEQHKLYKEYLPKDSSGEIN